MTKINKILIGILIILSLASNASAMSKVIITFDDGWTDDYYKALPIMQANHQNGTAFIITGEIANASGRTGIEYMNLSQLKALYSAGWDLSSHTVTHSDLTTLSATSLNSELVNSKAWLNNSGFTKASRFLAYPYGAYNSNVETAIKNAGYISARTVNYGNMTSNLYELPTLLTYGVPGYGSPATPVSYIETEINKSISSNGVLIITFHLISDVCCIPGINSPEEYKISDFKAISDFLKNKSDANQLQVITMSQYFNTSSAGTATLTVCPGGCVYSSIQDAINASSSGDTIEVQSGIYYENVNVNKQLTLRGIGPVVDARGSGNAITLAADGITLEGFTATGAGGYSEAGIKVTSSSNTLSGNNISNNNYGIYLEYSSNKIYNNYFNNIINLFIYTGSNTWNTAKTSGTNIIGGPYLGGNFWAYPNGTGFSQTCTDADTDGICDSQYTLDSNNIDYLPLAKNMVGLPKTGDINGNGQVTLVDAIYLAKHVGGFSGYETIYADGDINANGQVTLVDAIYLAKHVGGFIGYETIY